MNVRTLVVVALAVVCGISAMVLVSALRKPPSGPVIERMGVVFATAELKPGETIQEGMVEIREVPKAEVPEDAILKISDAIDRAAMSMLDKGDMLREKKLAEKGAGRGMAALIKTGMRAFTITTPSFSSSLAGFLLPGNHVDVLLTANTSGASEDELGGSTTVTLLQDVEILAVHTNVNTPSTNKVDPDQARSVTVLVTPEDAALLDLGQNKGTLHLTLRNLKDTASSKPKPTTLADLGMPKLSKPKPVVVEAPAPAPAPPPPAPDPLPSFDLQEPEMVEIRLAVRTLRGTSSGQDVLTMNRPAFPAKGNTRPGSGTGPGPGQLPPTGIARTASGEPVPGAPSTRGAGPPP